MALNSADERVICYFEIPSVTDSGSIETWLHCVKQGDTLSDIYSQFLPTTTSLDDASLTLHIDEEDRIHLAYYAPGEGVLYYVQLDKDGTPLTTPEWVDENAGEDNFLSGSVDSEGRFHLCYAIDSTELQHAERDVDGDWDIDEILEEVTMGDCAIQIDTEDNFHLLVTDRGADELLYASGEDGDWSEFSPLSITGEVSRTFSSYLDPLGGLHVAFETSEPDLVQHGLVNASLFTIVVDGLASDPTVTADSTGRPHLFVFDESGTIKHGN
jgi:hypothetical protein